MRARWSSAVRQAAAETGAAAIPIGGLVLLNASPPAPVLPLAGGLVLAVAAAQLTWWLLTTPHRPATASGAKTDRSGGMARWKG